MALSKREERTNRQKHSYYSRTTASFLGGLVTDLTILPIHRGHVAKKQQRQTRRVAKSQPIFGIVENRISYLFHRFFDTEPI
jgi:hypothetical protein